ncbi:hypothetical protein ASG90_18315 [Nocardioides sp. Soil797]|nr:hypothetical protein ASG90_18315 [Nocardioides sp. Soil797]
MPRRTPFSLLSAALATAMIVLFAGPAGAAPDNLPPIANDDSFVTAENTPVNGNVVANDSDPEGDPFAAALKVAPVHGTMVLNANGTFNYTPNPDFTGVDTFIYLLDDGTGRPYDEHPTATVTITVSASNAPPVAVDDHVTGDEDIPMTGNVLTNESDPDGDALTASLVLAPVNGTIVLNADGSFTYTPNANFHGPDSVTYSITDGHGADDTAMLFLQVVPVNDAPVAVEDTATTPSGNSVDGNVLTNDSDPDGDALTASLVLVPVNGTVVLNADGSFTYAPNDGYAGSDALEYQVCDNGTPSLCDTATLRIEIVAGNRAPAAVDDTFTVDEDDVLQDDVSTNDSDPDGDDLAYTIDGDATEGSLVLDADGSFSYAPALDFHGDDSFTYTVTDPDGLTAVGTVSITVASRPDVPVTRGDAYDATADEALRVTASDGVLANDTDPDMVTAERGTAATMRLNAVVRAINGLTATVADGPRHGSLRLDSNGGFTYTPEPGYVGADSFRYTATSASMTSSPQKVNLKVVAGGHNGANDSDDPAPPIDDSDQAATPPPASLPDTGGPEQAALWLSLALLVGGGVLMRGRRSTSA